MTPAQEQKAEAIFVEAIASPSADRERLLLDRCNGDEALLAYLRELLAMHDAATGFLAKPPSAVSALELDYDDFSPERLEEADRPERIGQFTIRGVLGRGGMGVVYLADSERPKRQVALKVIRADAASASLLRRFEHEAQVLALLQHPGIAQVYEAGVAEEHGRRGGRRPYFAMELVDGLPLTDFAARHDLNARARLALIASVCDAVQHAHTKGVIHRDLKPGNILVTQQGAPGERGEIAAQPKVLDFGVARLTDADVQVTTMQTDVGQLVGTVAYMSPEQVTGDPNAVDTRSDVYALGVILYELLTGSLPHRVRNVAITEALRTIREDDPAPLSSVDRMLRGDVDTIVRKALEKDPARRYQTAADLAADIRRYLNDEPITARPPSTYYQLSKFARRNRALVGGVAAAFLILVAGIVATTRMAVIAKRNEQRAIDKQNSFQLNSDFHEEIMTRVAAAMAAGDGETVLDILAQRAQAIDLRYADRPRERAAAERTIGSVYAVLGNIPVAHGENGLAAAERHLAAAAAAYEQFAEPTDRDYLRTLARLGGVLLKTEDMERASRVIERASRLAASALPASDPARLDVETVYAEYLFKVGRMAEAEAALRNLVDQQRAAARSGDDRADVALIQTERDLGQILHRQGHLEEALVLYREALQRCIARPDMGPRDPETLIAMERVAALLRDLETQESLAEAEQLLTQAYEGLDDVLGADHFITIRVRRNLAMLFWTRAQHDATPPEQRDADLARALAIFEDVVAIEDARGVTPSRKLLALSNMVAVQFERAAGVSDPVERAARFAQAAETFKAIAKIRRETLPAGHRDTLLAENNAARAILFQARALRESGGDRAAAALLAEAESMQRGVVVEAARTIGDNSWMTGHVEDRYAEILIELGRADEAVQHSARAVQILEATYGADHARTKEARQRFQELSGTLEASRQ